MSEYGIVEYGFNRKTYNVLLEQYESELKSQNNFGNEIDFSEQDPLYQITVPYIYMISELWEVAEYIFYATSPKFAEGVPLSNTGKFIGISRKQATKAIGSVIFTGSPGTNIQQGFLISTESGIVFQTTQNVTISSEGNVTVNIEAQEAGEEGNVPGGTIVEIINPTIGISSVTNVTETTKGQNIETDTNFRDRYEQTTTSGQGSTANAIRNNILTVTGVRSATVKENDTSETINNIPGHSIYVLVQGGDNTEVANAIFAKKPVGIGTYGTISINIVDTQGISHIISFSRPVNKNVWIKVTITKTENYPIEADELIKDTIIKYINSLSISEDVIVYKIINLIAQLGIQGVEDIQIQLSLDGTTYQNNNIIIENEETAITDNSKVVITDGN
ncbi:baseplate J/gp47 family protein [Clostridium rectalis]|uniref:baseplate J/gp47 family protein n=1 Tax=Clostridium rectalis TaxID=2040295 RepID=UPI000F63049D|nr:baseplate J/gp47 family protein [Clostridium rectalis]